MSAPRLRVYKIKPSPIGKCLLWMTARKTEAAKFATNMPRKTVVFMSFTKKTAVRRAHAMLRSTKQTVNIFILWIPMISPSRRCLPIWSRRQKSIMRSWSFPVIILTPIIPTRKNIHRSRVWTAKCMLHSVNSARTHIGCSIKTFCIHRGINCIRAIISAKTNCIFRIHFGMIFRSI